MQETIVPGSIVEHKNVLYFVKSVNGAVLEAKSYTTGLKVKITEASSVAYLPNIIHTLALCLSLMSITLSQRLENGKICALPGYPDGNDWRYIIKLYFGVDVEQ